MKTATRNILKAIIPGIGAATLLLNPSSVLGGSATWSFDTDPTLSTDPHPLKIYQGQTYAYKDSTGKSVYWKGAGGNPATGGFLGVTWPIGSSSTIVVFPDIDNGGLVTSFKLETDLRIGNPQQNERAADGFSINFARSNDPVIANPDPNNFATGGAVETGTQTGLGISFDTWQGNSLPDGPDCECIIIRVDNVTIQRYATPTRNGACNDATSLQTGGRNLAYWTYWKTNGFDQNFNDTDTNAVPPVSPDAAFAPDSWSNLCWQHLSVELDAASKLTIIWKGITVLDHFQTTFFPSAGAIILAGRTGGADEHTHFDNMTLTTSAAPPDTVPPTVPTGFVADTPVGSSRVALHWNPATDASGRVAYELYRDALPLRTTLTTTQFVDTPNLGGHAYTYTLRALDVSLNYSAFVTNVVTTGPDAPTVGSLRAEIFDNISGTDIISLLGDTKWNDNTPNRTTYALGTTAGSPNGNAGWNNSFGDSYGMRITGTVTPAVAGNYNFFIRSDDSSQFYLNQTNATIPDANLNPELLLIEETGCCHAFLEPNDTGNTGMTTTNGIPLKAGTAYGFTILLKEGGGGDGVAVGWRLDSDTTPAGSLPPIAPIYLKGNADSVGSSVTITTQPAATTVVGNEPATFTVAATHTNNYSANIFGSDIWYQWMKNGAPIPGATAPTLNIPAAAVADNSAQITAVVGTEGLVVTSAVAVLTVTADNIKPTVASVNQGDVSFTKLVVNFSEPVTAPTASTAANYSLSGGATVSAATLSADGFSVTLTTSALTANTKYTLTVNNVADRAGNAIVANTTATLNSWVKTLSAVNVAFFGSINGTTVDTLTNDTRYPNTPDSTFTSTNGLEIGLRNGLGGWFNSYGANYGMRITGTLSPPGTGAWNFFIRSDDSSALFLNTTGASLPDTSLTPIAYEPGCCNTFQEPGTAAQTTKTPINLTLGQQYGFVVLLKEGGGGDGVAVGMRIVGDKTPAANVPSIADAAPVVVAPPSNPTLSVSRTGNTVSITYTGTLQSSATVNGTYTAVAGATSPYTVNTSSAKATFYRSH
jgi:hypothetical protein